MSTVIGIVKWFDASKGFGFIESSDTAGEILLTIGVVKKADITNIYGGDILTVETVSTDKGLRATKILKFESGKSDIDFPESEMTKKVEGAISEWEIATVMWFNRLRGFGLFDTNEGDAFIHMETIRKSGFTTSIERGESYMIKYGFSESGLVVTNISSVRP